MRLSIVFLSVGSVERWLPPASVSSTGVVSANTQIPQASSAFYMS